MHGPREGGLHFLQIHTFTQPLRSWQTHAPTSLLQLHNLRLRAVKHLPHPHTRCSGAGHPPNTQPSLSLCDTPGLRAGVSSPGSLQVHNLHLARAARRRIPMGPPNPQPSLSLCGSPGSGAHIPALQSPSQIHNIQSAFATRQSKDRAPRRLVPPNPQPPLSLCDGCRRTPRSEPMSTSKIHTLHSAFATPFL
jgi:hypothetical protein